jgi:hypothetical protein
MAIVIAGIRKEILSFEYDGTVVKGPLRAHVGVPFIRMGVMVKPL